MKSSIANAIVAGLMLSGVAVADTINVPGDYPTIQGAIDASFDGDTVQVEAGIYYEYIRPKGKPITIQGSLGPDGQHLTTIDAEQASTVVLFESGEDQKTVLRDFIITGGGGVNNGGGIECLQSSPTIVNCQVTGNAVLRGAGLYCQFNSSPFVLDCVFIGNTAKFGGAGVACFADSNPTLTSCMITGNAAGMGGGVFCEDGSNPTFSDCVIAGNTASSYGGGLYCNESSPTLKNVSFSANTAGTYGGAIYCSDESSPSIIASSIEGNSTTGAGGNTGYGGGIFLANSSNPNITTCVIHNNTSNYGGGVRMTGNCEPTIFQTSIRYNTADINGGGISCSGTNNPILVDSVVCGNVLNQICNEWTDGGGNVIADVCPPSIGACCTGNDLICVSNVQESDCLLFGGNWQGIGTFCTNANCPSDCLGDADGDGEVSVNDILLVIARFGVTCP